MLGHNLIQSHHSSVSVPAPGSISRPRHFQSPWAPVTISQTSQSPPELALVETSLPLGGRARRCRFCQQRSSAGSNQSAVIRSSSGQWGDLTGRVREGGDRTGRARGHCQRWRYRWECRGGRPGRAGDARVRTGCCRDVARDVARTWSGWCVERDREHRRRRR